MCDKVELGNGVFIPIKKEPSTLVELNSRGNGLFLSDKGTIHNYLSINDELFLPYKNKEINIFEVGYQYGGSCELWAKYFPKAKIRSIDINNCVPEPFCDRIKFDVMNVEDLSLVYFNEFCVDIAIDDGSHLLSEQIHFIQTVHPVIREGGILIVEDIKDIDNQYNDFKNIGFPFKVVDRRSEQNRFDEVLLLFTK